jgi:hypothetical protein
MDRRCQLRLQHLRHHGEAHRDEALHVGGAAAVESAVALDERERIGAPVLPGHRYHVGMTRPPDAGLVGRPGRHPQRRFPAGLIDDALRGEAEAGEIILDVIDQRQIGLVAHRVEADEIGEKFLDVVGTFTWHDRRESRPVCPSPNEDWKQK